MPTSGLEDRIGTGWEGKQYLLGPRHMKSRMAYFSGPSSLGLSRRKGHKMILFFVVVCLIASRFLILNGIVKF